MKKVYVILSIIMLVTVYAFGNNNSNNGSETNAEAEAVVHSNIHNNNRNENRNLANQAQGQLQGQIQGQIANGVVDQTVDQGNAQNVNVAGDETKTKVYANQWPSLSGGQGVSQANAYSIFGGLGVSSTEEYKVKIEQLMIIDSMQKLGYFTPEEAKNEALKIYKQIVSSTKDKRVLGVLWKTTGRNLSNLLGLLSWDSFWIDGRTPVDIVSKPTVKTIDK